MRTVENLAAIFRAELGWNGNTSALDLAMVAGDHLGIDDSDAVETMADRLYDRQCHGDTLEQLALVVLEEWT